MAGAGVVNIVIAVGVVAWVMFRQLSTRPLGETFNPRLVLGLAVLGLVQMYSAVKGHSVGANTVVLVVAGIALGVVFGLVRGLTFRVWRDESGIAWRRGTALTAGLWLLSLVAHFGIDLLAGDSSTAKSLASASILVYLAVTLGTQREFIRYRASRLVPAGTELAGSW